MGSDAATPLRHQLPRSRRRVSTPLYPTVLALAVACSALGCIVEPVDDEADAQPNTTDTSADGVPPLAPTYPNAGADPDDAAPQDAAAEAEPAQETVDEVAVAGCSVSPFTSATVPPVPVWVVAAAALAALRRRNRRLTGGR